MTDNELITKFNLEISAQANLESATSQAERILHSLKRLEVEAPQARRVLEQVFTTAQGRIGSNISDELKNTAIEQAFKERESKEAREKYHQDQQIRNRLNKLGGVTNPFAFISPKTGVNLQLLLNNVSRLVPAMQPLTLLFQAGKGAWNFAEAVAELNTKIIQLGASSGMSAQKLMDLGAAVAAFGGSAEKVAASNERFVLQIERMKRGGGLGYLGDVAYKYGFSVDMNAGWEANNRAAINYARTLSKEARMAFLKEWDPSQYVTNMMLANMSPERVAANEAYYKRYDQLGDTKAATEATQEFNEETAKLQRAWTAITNQIATALLPVMTGLVRLVRGLADWLARSPGILKVILGLVTAIAVGFMLASGGLTAAMAAVTAGLGLLGGAAYKLSGGKGGGQEQIESVMGGNNVVPLNQVFAGSGGTLNARTKYGLFTQFGTIHEEAKERIREQEIEGLEKLTDASTQLKYSFGNLKNTIVDTMDSMKGFAETAMDAERAERQYASIINSNSMSNNISNRNGVTNINTNIETNINNPNSSADAVFDAAREAGQEFQEALNTAARYNSAW